MVPSEIVEEIFAYLSRDVLDHCQIICLKWSKLIESSKRLSQRRIVSLDYNIYYPDKIIIENILIRFQKRYLNKVSKDRFWMKLKSSTGKTIRIVDDPNQQELPASRVFKNVIIDELVVHNKNVFNRDLWRIFESAGFRIIVKRVLLKITRIEGWNIEEMLEHFHDPLTEYIDTDEIAMKILNGKDDVLFNKESWKYFDFGKKTEINLLFLLINSTNDFFKDTFKEFISGKYMKRSKLNELQIFLFRIDSRVIFRLIVEAFCDIDEPHKFFKSIKTSKTSRINYFDKIDGEFGFVREDQEPQKYRLSHPKLKWALEATQPPDELLKFQLIEL